MPDDNWNSINDIATKAATLAGSLGFLKGGQLLISWWNKRKADNLTEEQRADVARQKQLDGIDARNRADIERARADNDRANADNDRLRGIIDKYRAERDTKDAEMNDARWREVRLRGLLLEARQAAESACRLAKQPAPAWPELPELELRPRNRHSAE